MAYTLTTNYDNPPSLVVALARDEGVFPTRSLYRFKMYSDDAGAQLVANSGWITLSESTNPISYTFASVSPGTYYITAESDDPITFVSLQQTVLVDNTPRAATQSQWEDLAARVKTKANASSLSTVATSGSYNDLSNKPTVPTITMTNVDPGEGSALSANNYVAVYGGDPIILDYSTSEINTGAKWIDGSAIYKKTVSTGTLPDTNASWTQHGISNMSKVIKAEGYATDGTTFHPLPYANTASNGSVAVQVTSTNIMLSTTSDQSAYTESYITLYYTKSSS